MKEKQGRGIKRIRQRKKKTIGEGLHEDRRRRSKEREERQRSVVIRN